MLEFLKASFLVLHFSYYHSPLRGINPPLFQIITHYWDFLPPHFLKSPSPTLPANNSSQVFIINRNATVTLSLINRLCKTPSQCWLFHFKFTLKHMLDTINTCQVMFIYKLILPGRFSLSFQFLCCIQKNPSCLTSKQLARKDFSMQQLPVDSYMLLCKQKTLFQLTNKSSVFNLIAI